MSLVPLVFRDWWDDFDVNRPSRLLDQHFGTGLRRDDLLNSLDSLLPRSGLNRYYRPWRSSITTQDSGSTISADQEKFQVILDVQQFSPEEITVKTSNGSIIVEGRHQEKRDEHGYISRHFVRRYVLPQELDIADVVSTLSSDGVLTITAPKKTLKDKNAERVVPITQTGPAKQTVQPVIEEKL